MNIIGFLSIGELNFKSCFIMSCLINIVYPFTIFIFILIDYYWFIFTQFFIDKYKTPFSAFIILYLAYNKLPIVTPIALFYYIACLMCIEYYWSWLKLWVIDSNFSKRSGVRIKIYIYIYYLLIKFNIMTGFR